MEIITIFLIAVGLSMDAFAVSIAGGLTMEKLRLKSILRIALFFGGFQAIMPLIGFSAGLSVREYITHFDHWIAFLLLLFVGTKMIHESFSAPGEEKKIDTENTATLLVLAIATSIDALAVGLSLSFLRVDIVFAAALIGITTFIICFAGVIIGKQTGHLLGNKIEILGGIILIGIGIKILVEHLA